MARRTFRDWLAPLAWVFLGGVLVIGPLDLFHTCNGIQTYLIRRALTPQCNWPWFIPFQMGFAGILMLTGWHWFKKTLSGRFRRRENRLDGERSAYLIPLSGLMVGLSYWLGYALVDSPWHLNAYLILWIFSLLFLSLTHSRIFVVAFIVMGIWGLLAESILLNPGVAFFSYAQKDLLGRAPGWLLPVYGWVGAFIQEISRKLDDRLD